MDHIDQFSSMFKRAERTPFVYTPFEFASVIVLLDDLPGESELDQKQLTRVFPILEKTNRWRFVHGNEFQTVGELIGIVEEFSPDLVITKRCLQERGLVPQHSLGVYVDVLTQVLSPPVLLLPETPASNGGLPKTPPHNIMIVTDQIAGQDRLISVGAAFGAGKGDVWLCHVEDDAVFERYQRAIERIPEIDTADSRKLIQQQFFNEASDFIQTAIADLKTHLPEQTFHTSISRGHRVKQYLNLVENHKVDLLVLNTKDDDQLAMHGNSYALSVELVKLPLLLL